MQLKVPFALTGVAAAAGFLAWWTIQNSIDLDRLAAPTCNVACSDSAEDRALRAGERDAREAIQLALDASIPGVVIALPPGEFAVSGPLSVPDEVSLVGAGANATTIVAREQWRWAFRYSFLVTSDQSDGTMSRGVTVRDLALKGGYVDPAVEDDHEVGGIKTGDGWRVRRVLFSDLGYFKVWIRGVSGVSVSTCLFHDTNPGTSSGHDNIGGGDARDVDLRGNVFTASASGNAIDLVRSTRVRIEENKVEGSPERPRSIYLEGVQEAEVRANTVAFGSIAVQSNAEYRDHDTVINPRAVTVADNVVSDAPSQGISVRYDDPREGQERSAASGAVGGGNAVLRNQIDRSGVAGIMVAAASPGLVNQADDVSSNVVANAFSRGSAEWNTGYGIARAAGIVIGVGDGTQVADNLISGEVPEQPRYGVQVGVRSGRGVPVTVTDVETTRISGTVERAVLDGS